MTEYVTGQNYGWNGGECPVHPDTKVKIWTRAVLVCSGVDTDAGLCAWEHKQDGMDIVCFQVITAYAEPKTIWVNEDESGEGTAYTSEKEAKLGKHTFHKRVAVKYVEVKE
jgi:hypothetical protein